MNLATYNAKRMVLVLHSVRARRVIRGTASYEQDPSLGAVLRILATAASDGRPSPTEIVLQEDTWEGDIVPDEHFGCDFAIDLFVK